MDTGGYKIRNQREVHFITFAVMEWVDVFQFWRQDNQPMEIYSPKFVFQKLSYIHNNPVEAGLVEKPEHYLYSSAKDYFQTKKCGLLDIVFL